MISTDTFIFLLDLLIRVANAPPACRVGGPSSGGMQGPKHEAGPRKQSARRWFEPPETTNITRNLIH